MSEPVNSNDEIEITPKMLRAGAFALTSALGGVNFSDWDDLAEQVFRAMRDPDGSEPLLSYRHNSGG